MSTASWSGQSLLNLGFDFHIVPHRPPSLLIFPLCARPGHLYQSARPTSKGKKKCPPLTARAILVIHVMPGGLVGQGAEFSRSSCVFVELTSAPAQKGFYLCSFPPSQKKKKKPTHPPLPYPPSAYLACRPDLLKLTLHQKYPLCLALLRTSRRLCREASSTSNCHRILFHLLHIPTKGVVG